MVLACLSPAPVAVPAAVNVSLGCVLCHLVVYLGTSAGDCGRMRSALLGQSAKGTASLRQAV